MADAEIQALNQILAMVDEKAALYKDQYARMPQARRAAEKTLLLRLIDDATGLANRIKPTPREVLGDLDRLGKQLSRMG
jgi:hypothetical protein